jgi:Fe2+ transport system protein FeoA
MRLTEEIVVLLKLIESKSNLASISSDAIEDAEHEGLITHNGHDAKTLTALGIEILKKIQSALITADQLSINDDGIIAYLSQNNYPRFQKLSSFGLFPGIPISLKQRYPSFVIQCEETQIALEEEILKDIFVWRG